jgi:hypothetical protein
MKRKRKSLKAKSSIGNLLPWRSVKYQKIKPKATLEEISMQAVKTSQRKEEGENEKRRRKEISAERKAMKPRKRKYQ